MALLVVASIGLSTGRSGGQEARAAARVPPADSPTAARPPSFLDSLSFTSTREPISVNADGLEFDYHSRVLTYTGTVVVTQGDMKLESNRLTVSLDEHADNQVKEVVAQGQVRLSKGGRWATGGRAVFDQTRGTVVLSDNAELHDGPNHVSGDRVVVFLDEQRSVVEGGSGRVKAVLFPGKGEPTPAAARGTP